MGNYACPGLLPRTFEQKYEVGESLGRGKFSEVYLCWDRYDPEKKYAMKIMRPTDPSGVSRIREEIDVMNTLGDHPNLMRLIDYNEGPGNKFQLVLDLCEGGELFDRVLQYGCYSERNAMILIKQLLEAVAYIHNRGIMHRDLKPENILLASKDDPTRVKISDFGLAKMSRQYPARLPRSNSICGSDFYLAPEVIKQEEYGREIDLWSIGVVAYVCMSGSLPFFHNVLHKLYRQIVERDISFPAHQWANVSKGAQHFILRLLQMRPGDRLTAEQAMNHPWLRSLNSPSGSVNTMSPSDMGPLPQTHADGSLPHRLEHAHRVDKAEAAGMMSATHSTTASYSHTHTAPHTHSSASSVHGGSVHPSVHAPPPPYQGYPPSHMPYGVPQYQSPMTYGHAPPGTPPATPTTGLGYYGPR